GTGAGGAVSAPADDERVNVLVIGRRNDSPLTDTMMLVSIDRTLGTATLVSIPRDMVDVPLGNGDTFSMKLNALYGYVERHPDQFPNGAMRTLKDAVGALLGIRVQYYADMRFDGFVRMVELAGG